MIIDTIVESLNCKHNNKVIVMLFGKSEPKLIMFKALLSRCKQINILVFSHHNLGVHSLQSRVRKEASDMTSHQVNSSLSFTRWP